MQCMRSNFKPLSVSKCVRCGRFYLFQSTRVPAIINYGEAQKKGLTLEQRRLLVSSIYIPRLSYFASKEETFCSLYRSKNEYIRCKLNKNQTAFALSIESNRGQIWTRPCMKWED